jgi:twitching motility two-component system response regulator PilG
MKERLKKCSLVDEYLLLYQMAYSLILIYEGIVIKVYIFMISAQGNFAMSKLIMVIDDSLTMRKIVEVSLKREGYAVVSFEDGVQALRALINQELPRIPDLIILDIDLPKINGYDIARYLRSKPAWKKTTIVILSRHDKMLDRFKAKLAGVNVYLTKPFNTQIFLDVVRANLGVEQEA